MVIGSFTETHCSPFDMRRFGAQFFALQPAAALVLTTALCVSMLVAGLGTGKLARPAGDAVAIVLAGLCGGLIGYAVMDLQCTDGCTTYAGLVGIGAAILAAGGVAIVAVLTLRAMSEWEAVEVARADDT